MSSTDKTQAMLETPAYIPKGKTGQALGVFLVFLALFAVGPLYMILEVRYATFIYRAALMWTPALAVFATLAVYRTNLAGLGWNWPGAKPLIHAYLLPLAYGLMAYGIIWLFFSKGYAGKDQVKAFTDWLGVEGWPHEAVVGFSIFVLVTFGMIGSVARSLGEEIGWRGFLAPLLHRRFGYLAAVVGVALIAALWHFPLIVYSKYNAGPYDLYGQFANYCLFLLGWSFIHTYLRLKYRSLWPCVMLHAAHNMIVVGAMQELTTPHEETWRYTAEFGTVLPLVIMATGLIFWWRASAEGLTRRG